MPRMYLVAAAIGLAGCGGSTARPTPITANAGSGSAAADSGSARPPVVHDTTLIGDAARGEALVTKKGCIQCHSTDGSELVGPTFHGILVRLQTTETKFADGRTLAQLLGDDNLFPTIDDYLRVQTLTPRVVDNEGYPPVAPSFEGQISDQEMADIIAWLKTS